LCLYTLHGHEETVVKSVTRYSTVNINNKTACVETLKMGRTISGL